MKKLTRSTFCFLFTFFLAGCYSLIPPSDPTSAPNTNQQDAQRALVNFFHYLHKGDYQSGAELYSGSYEWLIELNPDIDPIDFPALLERGCQQNGFMCLEVRSAEAVLLLSSKGYVFEVEFQLDDGSLFERKYCCGANETEKPPITKYQYRVLREEDGYWRVTDLPPYVP